MKTVEEITKRLEAELNIEIEDLNNKIKHKVKTLITEILFQNPNASYEELVNTEQFKEIEKEVNKSGAMEVLLVYGFLQHSIMEFVDNRLNASRINEIIQKKWTNEAFQDRIANNKADMLNRLKQFMASASSKVDSTREIRVEVIKELSNVLEEEVNRNMNAVKTIAITETTHYSNEAKVEVLKEDHKNKAMIIAELDERTCETCIENNGKMIDLNKDKNPLPFHPRCRCSLVDVDED